MTITPDEASALAAEAVNPEHAQWLAPGVSQALSELGWRAVQVLQLVHVLGDSVTDEQRVALSQTEQAQTITATVLALEHSRKFIAEIIAKATNDVLRHVVPFQSVVETAGGLWRLSRSDPAKRYDNDLLIDRVGAALADDAVRSLVDETGEMPPIGAVVTYAVRKMAKATGAGTQSFNSWRKGAMKQLGIDLESYEIESTPGGPLKVTAQR